MEIAISVVALLEIAVLMASAVALLGFAVRTVVRSLRRMVRPEEEDLATRGSGGVSVPVLLAQLGMQVSDEDLRKLTAAVKAHARKSRRMLSPAEFRDLADRVLDRAAA